MPLTTKYVFFNSEHDYLRNIFFLHSDTYWLLVYLSIGLQLFDWIAWKLAQKINTLTAKDGDLHLSAPNAWLPKTEISVIIVLSRKSM